MVVSGLLTAEYTAWAVIMLRVGRKKTGHTDRVERKRELNK